MAQIITSTDQIDFSVNNISSMPSPTDVLLVRPLHYSVDYVINPHMAEQVGKVDRKKAYEEWKSIGKLYENMGIETHIIEDEEELPDMVFSANQSLPFLDENGKRHVFMSIMKAEQRKEEVPHIEQWFRQQGYELHFLDDDSIDNFEGCGDALWHSNKRLLWGGYGYRSSLDAYEAISDTFNVPVITLKLMDENFYHLDTCLCILNPSTALIYPDAFNEEGLSLINTLFDDIIEAPEEEAKKRFACNAACPDGENVIIQRGCAHINKELKDLGFTVHEVNTEEFLKSGGSVFCMKQMVW